MNCRSEGSRAYLTWKLRVSRLVCATAPLRAGLYLRRSTRLCVYSYLFVYGLCTALSETEYRSFGDGILFRSIRRIDNNIDMCQGFGGGVKHTKHRHRNGATNELVMVRVGVVVLAIY